MPTRISFSLTRVTSPSVLESTSELRGIPCWVSSILLSSSFCERTRIQGRIDFCHQSIGFPIEYACVHSLTCTSLYNSYSPSRDSRDETGFSCAVFSSSWSSFLPTRKSVVVSETRKRTELETRTSSTSNSTRRGHHLSDSNQTNDFMHKSREVPSEQLMSWTLKACLAKYSMLLTCNIGCHVQHITTTCPSSDNWMMQPSHAMTCLIEVTLWSLIHCFLPLSLCYPRPSLL